MCVSSTVGRVHRSFKVMGRKALNCESLGMSIPRRGMANAKAAYGRARNSRKAWIV